MAVAGVLAGTLVLAAFVVWVVRRTEPAPSRASLVGAASLALPPPEELAVGDELVHTEVRSSGDVVVTHWLRSTALMFTVRLALPRDARTEGVVAEDVLVVADGRAVDGATQVSGASARYGFIGASTVQVSYRLIDATDLSDSSPGRGFVRTTAIEVKPDVPSDRVVRIVSAPRVLTLACSSGASTDWIPCGSSVTDGEWRVEQDGPGDGDRVSAAIDVGSQG